MSAAPETKAMVALRRTRQKHRLGNLEWFEAAYKVYIVGLFGGGIILWLSGLVGDDPVSASAAAQFERNAPAVLGLLAVGAFAAGLRSGAQGGPLALEAPDVSYIMMSPVDRRRALLRPAVQRLRSSAFMGGLLGAIAGQLAGRRLPGSTAAWAASGLLFGVVVVAALWAGAALVAHALHLRQWIATIIGLALLAWQAVAVARHIPGPGTPAGSLALWGWRQDAADAISIVVAAALVAGGLLLLRRTSLDALARRSGLVAQLRFAVTMQDLRTVILLRRQLNQEQSRRRPWLRVPRTRHEHPVWRRGWHGLLRMPGTRIIRMAALAALAGVCQGLVVRGTTPALLAAGGLLFILGLEVMEPLSQEIDQPDLADGLPIARGPLMFRHLAAPAVALVPFAAIGAVAATITVATGSQGQFSVGGSAAVAAILCVPTILGGCAGAVVSIVRDAPDPAASVGQQAFLPPEMAGVTTMLRVLIPLVVSTLGVLNVLLVRQAIQRGDSPLGAALRSALGTVLFVAACAYWVRKRDDISKAIKGFMNEGRDYTAQQRSAR